MDNPFFSIIIPTYNRAKHLAEVVLSVLQQEFESYELIIVDDGSTDETEKVIEPFLSSQVRYYRTDNFERSHARNEGARLARGEYLNFFDSDDLMYPDRLQKVFDFIERRNRPDVMYTHYDLIDESKRIVGSTNRYYKSFTKDIIFNNFLATGSVFLKRSIAIVNRFEEDRRIITAEDWELWLRVHAKHDFEECTERTFAIVQHENRSLSTISSERIEERDKYLIDLVKNRKQQMEKYGRLLNRFVSDRYTFMALVMAIEKKKMKSSTYLIKSLNSSFAVLGRRRFWGVLKNIIKN